MSREASLQFYERGDYWEPYSFLGAVTIMRTLGWGPSQHTPEMAPGTFVYVPPITSAGLAEHRPQAFVRRDMQTPKSLNAVNPVMPGSLPLLTQIQPN
jgi:hypothetical protein